MAMRCNCDMRINPEAGAPITLVTETECELARTILLSLPSPAFELGRGESFAQATDEDRNYGMEIAVSTALLSAEATKIMKDSPAHLYGRRQPDTFGRFPEWSLLPTQSATFADAAFLLATQQPEVPLGFDDAQYHAIHLARTMSAVLLEADPTTQFDTIYRPVFQRRFEALETRYKQSAGKGAQLILQRTHDEFKAAAPHRDPLEFTIGQSTSPALIALSAYQRENPTIAKLSNYYHP